MSNLTFWALVLVVYAAVWAVLASEAGSTKRVETRKSTVPVIGLPALW